MWCINVLYRARLRLKPVLFHTFLPSHAPPQCGLCGNRGSLLGGLIALPLSHCDIPISRLGANRPLETRVPQTDIIVSMNDSTDFPGWDALAALQETRLREAWDRGAILPDMNPDQFRNDSHGWLIQWDAYGQDSVECGWELERVRWQQTFAERPRLEFEPIHWYLAWARTQGERVFQEVKAWGWANFCEAGVCHRDGPLIWEHDFDAEDTDALNDVFHMETPPKPT